MEYLTFKQLAAKYCDRQMSTPGELKDTLQLLNIRFEPLGFMLLECQTLDSSYCDQLTILPYGPNNTFKEIPNHPFSPRGLASDMSVVIGIMDSKELD